MISIIIPAHNEQDRIEATLQHYFEFFKHRKTKKHIDDFEIIVVLNACNDNTINIVKKYIKNKEVRYIEFKTGGKGFAIKEGFGEALKSAKEDDLIGFIDADMSTSPQSFYYLVKHIGDADGAISDRWHRKSIFKYSFAKKLRSRIYNFWVRALFLFPYRDTQCGAKVFKAKILRKVVGKIMSSDFNFDVALLFALKKETNSRIKALPTTWEEKEGSTVLSVKSPLRMFLSAIRLRLMHSPFKFVTRFYRDVLPEKLKLHILLK